MKKSISAFMAAALLCLTVGAARADNISQKRGTIANWDFVASSNAVLQISPTGQLLMQDGIETKHETWVSLPAVSTNGVFSVSMPTGTLISGSTTFLVNHFTQPAVPMALLPRMWIDTGSSTATFVSTLTIVGMTAQGETIRYSVKIGTFPLVTGPAFASISSVTFRTTQASTISVNAATVYLVIGTTGTYGLAGSIEKNADVIKVRAWTVDASSMVYNTTWDTVAFPPSAGLSTNLNVWYRNTRSSPPRPK